MYKERREKVFDFLPMNSIAMFLSGNAPYQVGDEKYPFDVNRSFYYLTGIDRENLVLMLIKTKNNNQTILFIEPFDPVMAKWVGGKIQAHEATEISGISDVRFIDDLDSTINRLLHSTNEQAWTLCGELSKQELKQPWPLADMFNEYKQQYPDVMIKNIFADMARLRMVKSKEEIDNMKKAIAVTNAGI